MQQFRDEPVAARDGHALGDQLAQQRGSRRVDKRHIAKIEVHLLVSGKRVCADVAQFVDPRTAQGTFELEYTVRQFSDLEHTFSLQDAEHKAIDVPLATEKDDARKSKGR
jgi:hypothetical protein